MMTEEQLQSSDIPHANGTEDAHEDEASASTASSAPPARRSRFFRSKRKQRLAQGDDDTAHSPDETTAPSESPEQENVEASPPEVSTNEDDAPVEPTVPPHSSTPPLPASTDSTDGLDATSINDTNAEREAYLAKKAAHEKRTSTQSKAALSATPSGYTRRKSQSVKLTRIDPIDVGPKKNVRFADDFGLDLSQVKVIKSDEIPHVPSAAFKDLHISESEATNIYQEKMKTITYLEQRFENPIHMHGFEDRVARHKVALEQANAIDNRIYGTIKVISFGLNKRVKVRLTADDWATFKDYDSVYIMDSFDGTSDRFTFTIEIPRDRVSLGNTIQLCVGYESFVSPEYWDNNYQQNYRFDCISRSIPDYNG